MHQHSKEKKVLHAPAKQGEKGFACNSIARRKSFYMQQHSKEKKVFTLNYYWHCTDNWCCAKRFTVVIDANAR